MFLSKSEVYVSTSSGLVSASDVPVSASEVHASVSGARISTSDIPTSASDGPV